MTTQEMIERDGLIAYAKRVVSCLPFAMDASSFEAQDGNPSPFSSIDETFRACIKEIEYLNGRINDLMLGAEVDDIPNRYGGQL